MDHHFVDGPPDDRILADATDAVRDEVGSKLCAWVENGTRRVCKINTGLPCLCREVAETVLMVAARTTIPEVIIAKARAVVDRWPYANIGDHPMIEELAELRDQLKRLDTTTTPKAGE